MKTALLLSGGIDSICLAWIKRPDYAVTVNYGQLSAEAENVAAKAVCNQLGIEHLTINVDCSSIGSGDLAGVTADKIAPATDWWPYRNQMLITFAAMRLVALNVTKLYIGSVKSDSYHKDGCPEFVAKISSLISFQEGGMTIEAPAISFTSTGLIVDNNVPLSLINWSHSCHKENVPCGNCRGCFKHMSVMHELETIGYVKL